MQVFAYERLAWGTLEFARGSFCHVCADRDPTNPTIETSPLFDWSRPTAFHQATSAGSRRGPPWRPAAPSCLRRPPTESSALRLLRRWLCDIPGFRCGIHRTEIRKSSDGPHRDSPAGQREAQSVRRDAAQAGLGHERPFAHEQQVAGRSMHRGGGTQHSGGDPVAPRDVKGNHGATPPPRDVRSVLAKAAATLA
jgi:hypothetical protein